jgi:hypothetical protein
MIKKIISGGQTGADRAALDAAIHLGIPHGGWIPKGRIAEDGVLPGKYLLTEMPTKSYSKRTEKNVIDSDGTVIISNGKLTGGSAHTRTIAKKHGRPFLQIDLLALPKYRSSSKIVDWMTEYDIEVLNVAGPRASKDPTIYNDVAKIIEGVFYLGAVRESMSDIALKTSKLSDSVEKAVDEILETFSLAEKALIANMTERELSPLKLGLIAFIQGKIDSCGVNEALKEDCIRIAGKQMDEAGASTVIIDQIWERLKESHQLRVVK